jgi:hypothetical protein
VSPFNQANGCPVEPAVIGKGFLAKASLSVFPLSFRESVANVGGEIRKFARFIC